jgi:hypothetical protein
MEQAIGHELKDKEYQPPGRKNMLYIGDEGFPAHLEKLMVCKRAEGEKLKEDQKFKRNL